MKIAQLGSTEIVVVISRREAGFMRAILKAMLNWGIAPQQAFTRSMLVSFDAALGGG